MADKSLFTRLQRLFSTDVIIRNQGGNELKVIKVPSDYQNEYHTIITYDNNTGFTSDNFTLDFPFTVRGVDKRRKCK
jgi:hypothetical protein